MLHSRSHCLTPRIQWRASPSLGGYTGASTQSDGEHPLTLPQARVPRTYRIILIPLGRRLNTIDHSCSA